MDEETRQAFAELKAAIAELSGTLTARMNDQHERLLNRLASLEADFTNTKGFLVGDAVVAGRRWLDLDERVSRLERGQRGS